MFVYILQKITVVCLQLYDKILISKYYQMSGSRQAHSEHPHGRVPYEQKTVCFVNNIFLAILQDGCYPAPFFIIAENPTR